MPDLSFTIDRDAFSEAVTWAARVIPSKPQQPILAGMLVNGADDALTISSFDLDVSAEVGLSDATEMTSGSSLVSGRLLATIAKVLPRKPVHWHDKGTSVAIQCGKADFSLPTMLADQYPVLPILPADMGRVNAEDFSRAVAQVIGAASTDEARPGTMCVNLEVTSTSTLTLTTTNGHRIAMREINWLPLIDDDAVPVGQRLLIPTRALNEIGRLGDDDVYLAFSGSGEDANLLGIHGGQRRMTSRLVDDKFPDCRSVMPKEYNATAAIVIPDVIEAVSRALTVTGTSSENHPRMRLTFDDDALTVYASTSIGTVNESLDAELTGDAITLWLNPVYFMDSLNSLNTDKATIGLREGIRGLMLAPGVVSADDLIANPLVGQRLQMIQPIRHQEPVTSPAGG
ncbi:DNA polymerase III subunit beta [Mycobacteroides abscessus]|uniref:DNA polymerase III subunit beta n=1 Tax=Mycobacteroides abscessus TaxID=36809 RepID=UPI0009277537|nr:DNA polymerase III subunit beta [Mycobacteroides abscessus]DAZ90370.1 TPA_asm: DNA polymerase III sliding clamp (Beta) [Mycobacterium phage prophiFSQJ01-1]SII41836.1 DNA polymerase III subunit beta [Mycobacteroides abscessus subsp. abscessus]SIK13246.1 DNA polymerase III subunit beta [Mycobacteroides abscessus subsp. abscessus]SIN25899.1 DNA polymerase III subunit beta [Mycobacteroides abscessus subsp. abscessus]SLI51041.1 DNA polymerase III subunit beta [Mycobacteroides abscessus subsp. ab